MYPHYGGYPAPIYQGYQPPYAQQAPPYPAQMYPPNQQVYNQYQNQHAYQGQQDVYGQPNQHIQQGQGNNQPRMANQRPGPINLPQQRQRGPPIGAGDTPRAYTTNKGIVPPPHMNNDFDVKGILVQSVEAKPFAGTRGQNPMSHLERFNKYCDLYKTPGVPEDALKLRVFPFSLTGHASRWEKDIISTTITTWAECKAAFLQKFFPPHLTAALKSEITNFKMDPIESFPDALERFRLSISECPHHGYTEETLLSTFYRGVTLKIKHFLDGASNGNFLSRDVTSGWELLDNMAVSSSVEEYNRHSQKENGTRRDLKAVNAKLDKILNANQGDQQPSEYEDEEEEGEEHTEYAHYIQGSNQPRYQGNFRQNGGNSNTFRAYNQQSSFRNNQGAGQAQYFPNKQPLQGQEQNTYKPQASSYQQPPPAQPARQTTTTAYQQQTTTPAQPPSEPSPDIQELLQQILQGQNTMKKDLTASHNELSGKIDQLNNKVNQLERRVIKVEQNQASTSQVKTTGQLPSSSITNPRSHNVSAITISEEEHKSEHTEEYNPAEDNYWLAGYGRTFCPPTPKHEVPGDTPLKWTKEALARLSPEDYKYVTGDSNVQVGGGCLKEVKAVTITVQDEEPPPQAKKETCQSPEGLEENRLDEFKSPTQEEPSAKEPDIIEADKEDPEEAPPLLTKVEINLEDTIKEPDRDSHEESDEEFVAQFRLKKKEAEDMMITPSLPWIKKLEDPGVFTIPCSIGRMEFPKCMCDLGAEVSIMPPSVAATLGLTNFKSGKVKLQLADLSYTECLGILADVPVVVDNIIVPTDFAVIYMPNEPTPPLLLGRPFLSSTNALIDCTTGAIQLRFSEFRKPIFTREGEILGGTPQWEDYDDSSSEDSDTYTLEPLPPDEWSEYFQAPISLGETLRELQIPPDPGVLMTELEDSPRAKEEMNEFLDSEPEVMKVEAHKEEEVEREGAPRLQAKLPKLNPYPTRPEGLQKSRRIEVLKRLKDPGALTLPCSIAKLSFPKCLIDTGAALSVMPLSIAEKIGYKNFPIEEITLRMADLSIAENYGMIKYMPVRINGVQIPTDFVVIKMDKEPEYGLILGRPFLNTTNALMDMVEGSVSLDLGGPDRVTFPRYETIPYEESLLPDGSSISSLSSEEYEEEEPDPELEWSPPRSPPYT